MKNMSLPELEKAVNWNILYCLRNMEWASKLHNREFFDSEYDEIIVFINSLYHISLIDYAEWSAAEICLAASSVHIWYENNV